ncbi:MAG: hypothetical protein ACR2NU_14425 [Aeoliella sp.]
MTSETIVETELVTRSIARWGSVAAAVIFGVTFVTDKTLNWEIVAGQYFHILLVSGIFVGYALALTVRFEVLGSVIALASMLGAFFYERINTGSDTSLVFLAVGAPALFHVVAVVLHRFVLHHPKLQN